MPLSTRLHAFEACRRPWKRKVGFFFNAQFVCILLPVNHVVLRRAALRAGVNLVLAENHPEAILADFIV